MREYTDCPIPRLLVCSLLPIVRLLFEATIQDGVSLRKYMYIYTCMLLFDSYMYMYKHPVSLQYG